MFSDRLSCAASIAFATSRQYAALLGTSSSSACSAPRGASLNVATQALELPGATISMHLDGLIPDVDRVVVGATLAPAYLVARLKADPVLLGIALGDGLPFQPGLDLDDQDKVLSVT